MEVSYWGFGGQVSVLQGESGGEAGCIKEKRRDAFPVEMDLFLSFGFRKRGRSQGGSFVYLALSSAIGVQWREHG